MINLFYTDEASRTSTVSLNAQTDALITKVTLDEALEKCFDVRFDLQEQTLSLILKKDIQEDAQKIKDLTNTGYVGFTLAGYESEVKAWITIPMIYEKPVIRLSKKTVIMPWSESAEEDSSDSEDVVFVLKKEDNQWKMLSDLYDPDLYGYREETGWRKYRFPLA